MGLYIGETGPEQLLGPVDGQLLGYVHIVAAAVIALPRIALGVFVGQDRALGLQHRRRDDVFRGDQLQLVLLPIQFGVDGGPHRRIVAAQVAGEEGRKGGFALEDRLGHGSAPGVGSAPGLCPKPANPTRMQAASRLKDRDRGARD